MTSEHTRAILVSHIAMMCCIATNLSDRINRYNFLRSVITDGLADRHTENCRSLAVCWRWHKLAPGRSSLTNMWTTGCFTGMAADYIPRISSENCGYPFTYLGGRYHGCVENLENVTAACERWGCFAVNYSGAVCAANIGNTPYNQLHAFNPLKARCVNWLHLAIQV